ncbi:MAG: hypothetical protein A3J27_00360 [Candidatus Tectomicrobia bacterium RIFCSPLOWO2_12_FULL_69_37]|nr:MAG: hypothetical protein A3J27_00360 [Candidatus Tectomicrobia bacterium RIFCSPLOWO2_12_FULL_69_37]OGL64478.1 MAG: hypothetical protein A3I72_12785 [Candidatus Tectomicrobia bacterium RIFCSPLOWO2_02_FULL_70_19]
MDWVWILAFAGLMLVMHRFGVGCCGGHGHGDRKDHEGRGEKPKADDKGRQAAAQGGGGGGA